jgi:hypothetical protein
MIQEDRRKIGTAAEEGVRGRPVAGESDGHW